jgi:hypothetical protein
MKVRLDPDRRKTNSIADETSVYYYNDNWQVKDTFYSLELSWSA